MPPYPGEERLVTVFADLHYYFAQPTVRPTLHRFDKSSYFYIYYNSTRHTSRIEVANNPGTSDQDAFNGYIDTCHITNSSNFPTLMTILVDGINPTSPSSPKSGRDPEEWHLASGDPRDPNRMKYKLHTIDVYFWAQDDAKLVVECFRKLLPASQLDIPELETDPEPEPHAYQTGVQNQGQPATVMSPVVQNLENMAVHDPTYDNHNYAQRSAASPTSSFASHNLGPPVQAAGLAHQLHSPSPTISDISAQPGRQTSVNNSNKNSQNFTPMAYNPAAPAAPEPIAHREKTPPPVDGAAGTGLDQAARHDGAYRPGQDPQVQGSYGGYQPGQGGPPNMFGGGYASPPPQVGQPGYGSGLPQHTQGFSSPPPSTTAGAYAVGSPPSVPGTYASPPPAAGYSYGGSPTSQDQRSSVGAPSFGPGAASTISNTQTPVPNQGQRHSTAAEMYVPQQSSEPVLTPGTQFYSTLPQSSKPLSHVQPQYADYLAAGGSPVQQQQGTYQPPPGYNANSQQQQSSNPYDIHQQVYQPAEHETHGHGKKPSKSGSKNSKPSAVDRVEGKVSGLFKKLEKRIG